LRWILRRLLHGAALLLVVSALTFLFADLAPGGFLSEMRLDPRMTPEVEEALKSRYGLDRPVWERYGAWLGSVLRGELGYSFQHHQPVAPLILPRARNTLVLTTLATLLAWVLGLPLGLWAAYRPGGWVDRLGLAATGALQALPPLLLGLGALLLAVRTGALPAGGMTSPGFESLSWGAKLWDLGRHLLLPTLVLGLATLPVLVRHTRSAVAEALASPPLRTAQAAGIRGRRLLLRHALPVAANPLITLFGFSVATLLSGSLVVEVILSWPGLGPLMLGAVSARDLHVVTGVVVLSSALLVVGNLLADLLLYGTDPRLRDGLRGDSWKSLRGGAS
jgi:peptide/nickel transport system permease protein